MHHRLKKAWLTVIPAAIALAGCIPTPAQYRLNREVDRLCAKDGGVQVYEQVVLPRDRFDANGKLIPFGSGPNPELLNPKEYEYRPVYKVLNPGAPTLVMQRFQTVRRSDNKVLGEYVQYVRVGGGFPGEAFPGNAYGCQQSLGLKPEDTEWDYRIFVKEKNHD